MIPTPLATDLYEINMAISYIRRGMIKNATFSLFIRNLPPNRGFLVVSGVEDAIDYLENFSFSEDDLLYLKHLGYEQQVLERLSMLRFTGEVWAIPEGRLVFAEEPIIEVTAPIPEAQIAETALLNIITFSTSVASKAARCFIAAKGRTVVDFSLRRTQGYSAGMFVAYASAVAGFNATSNVEAARRFGLVPSGTMAHSYVQAFGEELTAFECFAEDSHGPLTLLVDTYYLATGIKNAISVFKRYCDRGRPLAIRIDSGDLLENAKIARKMLDEAGFSNVGIFASGGLDEYDIEELVSKGAPIDGFGIGTKLGVVNDSPYLDSVYKLVEYDGNPSMKFSEGKMTLPGKKQVFRRLEDFHDLIGVRDEAVPPDTEPILVKYMEHGKRIIPRSKISQARERFLSELGYLPEDSKRIRDPRPPKVSYTPALDDLRLSVAKRFRKADENR